MQSAIKARTRILPGRRIEFTSPDLPEAGEVDLIVVLPDKGATDTRPAFRSAREYLQSLPPLHRTAKDWERIERDLQEDRDSWDR